MYHSWPVQSAWKTSWYSPSLLFKLYYLLTHVLVVWYSNLMVLSICFSV